MKTNHPDNPFDPSQLNYEQICNQMTEYIQKQTELQLKMFQAYTETGQTTKTYNEGMSNYLKTFTEPQRIAIETFFRMQQQKAEPLPSGDDLKDFAELLQFNLELAVKGLNNTLTSMADFHLEKIGEAWAALMKMAIDEEDKGEEFFRFLQKQSELMEKVINEYPQAIKAIRSEFGFHFDSDGYVKVAETDRFLLYQVLPLDKKVKVREDGKPVILVPPYVLGENILCFLPGERKSYAHAYADQGTPTYIRVVKEISANPAVQKMGIEEDAGDTRYFCEKLKERHGRKVTLNGYCQGGFFATLAVLSGELDGLVDTLITCVTPLDGTRSHDLSIFMQNIPGSYTDLKYAVTELDNGVPVVSGKIMSWVYKLKSFENEAPLVTFYRDLSMFDKLMESGQEVSKTACAINYWLLYDQADMPVGVTQASFASYNIPVTTDGTLPIELFGHKLNFKHLQEKKINFLICVADADDLVDRDAALAPCDFVEAEVTIFPKGHAAIATSWSHPESKCALHTVFGNNQRGPVRYHLDIEAAEDAATVKSPETPVATASVKQTKKTAPKKNASKKNSVTGSKTVTEKSSGRGSRTRKVAAKKDNVTGMPAPPKANQAKPATQVKPTTPAKPVTKTKTIKKTVTKKTAVPKAVTEQKS